MLGNGQPLQGASAMIITEMSGLVAKKRMAEAKKNGLVRVYAQVKWEGAKVQDSKKFVLALALTQSDQLRIALYQGKMKPNNFKSMGLTNKRVGDKI